MSSHQVVSKYRQLLAIFAPVLLKKGSRFFGHDQIACMHFIVKRKCFGNDVDVMTVDHPSIPTCISKTCNKHEHACMRNRISFTSFPFKPVCKSVARSIRSL
eukprot:5226260-Karenia_brevis.AAC.1